MCLHPYAPGSHRKNRMERIGFWKQDLCHRYLRHRHNPMRNHRRPDSQDSGRYTPLTQEQRLVMAVDRTGEAQTVHPSPLHKSIVRIWAARDSDSIILRTMLKSRPRARVSQAGSHALRSRASALIRRTIQLDIRTQQVGLRRTCRIVLKKVFLHKASGL